MTLNILLDFVMLQWQIFSLVHYYSTTKQNVLKDIFTKPGHLYGSILVAISNLNRGVLFSFVLVGFYEVMEWDNFPKRLLHICINN